MKSVILKTTANYLLPLLLLFSVFILLRGHHYSGGGFVGGLVASIAFVLYAFAYGIEEGQKIFKRSPGYMLAFGLLLSVSMGVLPLFMGRPFMTGLWFGVSLPVIGELSSALFFDTGVYLLVIGTVLTILFTISESVQD